ncbi:MAG: hypothetical protein OEM93_06660 [Rhodospirillales bacterium]|nr:hypothetical protein [Rhodospirillales bacterium]MDH3791752.1 hypothetical protein [Rhodospirillales bacterium]MDH3919799.1 hypothetical protein [Rhodospirillales bacterium]MDH3969699.1 hypothetical protein [Rhodospirillales bacterium]
MALDPHSNLAVFSTIGEAVMLIRTHIKPYVVLVLLVTLPWAAAAALGYFDDLGAYAAQAADGQGGYSLEGYPIGTLLILWTGSFFIMVVFGIFWYRYVLLGAEGALKFGLGQFNGMFWRTTGYGLLLLVVCLVALAVSTVVVSLVGGVVGALLGAAAQPAVLIVIIVPLVLVAYAAPLAFMARLSLPFPAVALGEGLSFGESWSRTRGSTWRLVGAFLTASLPVALVGYALTFGLYYVLFDINIWNPAHAAAATDYWWVTLLMSPVMYVPVALCLAIVAIAYRDLGSSPAAETAPGVHFAR